MYSMRGRDRVHPSPIHTAPYLPEFSIWADASKPDRYQCKPLSIRIAAWKYAGDW